MSNWCRLLLFSAFFSLLSIAEESLFFYKNKFPGGTCVPLSFYISTQVGNEETRAFWDKIKGITLEDKFAYFLNSCQSFYKDYAASKTFFESSYGSEASDDQLPGGMWVSDLFAIIQNSNFEFSEKIKLRYLRLSSQNKNHFYITDELEQLRLLIKKSLDNSFAPIVAWNNLRWAPRRRYWRRNGGHGITVTWVDRVNVEKQTLSFQYIDNEDGLSKKGIFYGVNPNTEGPHYEIDSSRKHEVHVWHEGQRNNWLNTVQEILVSDR